MRLGSVGRQLSAAGIVKRAETGELRRVVAPPLETHGIWPESR